LTVGREKEGNKRAWGHPRELATVGRGKNGGRSERKGTFLGSVGKTYVGEVGWGQNPDYRNDKRDRKYVQKKRPNIRRLGGRSTGRIKPWTRGKMVSLAARETPRKPLP